MRCNACGAMHAVPCMRCNASVPCVQRYAVSAIDSVPCRQCHTSGVDPLPARFPPSAAPSPSSASDLLLPSLLPPSRAQRGVFAFSSRQSTAAFAAVAVATTAATPTGNGRTRTRRSSSSRLGAASSKNSTPFSTRLVMAETHAPPSTAHCPLPTARWPLASVNRSPPLPCVCHHAASPRQNHSRLCSVLLLQGGVTCDMRQKLDCAHKSCVSPHVAGYPQGGSAR